MPKYVRLVGSCCIGYSVQEREILSIEKLDLDAFQSCFQSELVRTGIWGTEMSGLWTRVLQNQTYTFLSGQSIHCLGEGEHTLTCELYLYFWGTGACLPHPQRQQTKDTLEVYVCFWGTGACLPPPPPETTDTSEVYVYFWGASVCLLFTHCPPRDNMIPYVVAFL